jgi:inhibitor of KinA sporulation pathway (predicted exonuclease)
MTLSMSEATHTPGGLKYAVVLDFEATCDEPRNPDPQEIIEFPSVLVRLSDGELVDRFESFVRPVHHPRLTDFCTGLTSIVQADVESAETFPQVFLRHQRWLESRALSPENAIIVTCGDWDLRYMLPAQLRASGLEVPPAIYRRWLNIKVPYKAVVGRPRGMARMLRGLGLPLVGRHHRGIDDCVNIAAILRSLVEHGAEIGPTSPR